ncbi:hypothetical protein BU16DRAFT_522650 [Lophium mytilinum]|uniref:FHA domain-containing protein n=1 Tax=Lophium mytilinum TaxID=390894 RepID=A0A6A6RE65_9PEZI|nr:hypothetical protein BU16DRAFT_522650 [Lophium mytilinum]
MWILEHDGNLFGGKKVWLKPGTQQIFGRTRPPQGKENGDGTNNIRFIDDKRVSRKHITITVSAVAIGEGTQLHSRSKVNIIESSKFGTSIDGAAKIKGETITLTKTEHTIQLGSWGELLRIKWQPVVFTFAISKKDVKTLASQAEALDMKTSMEYVFNTTTHVVTVKRNTPKCLLALLNARHIVTSSFVNAVIAATTAQNADPNNYIPSPFELDFEGNWPKESEYIPPVGQEPVARPADLFKPDPNRADMFGGYTFIFCDERQYENLSNAVNSGGGKALLFPLQHGQTTVGEFEEFVRSTTGNKGIGEFGPGKSEKGVVVIRYTTQDDDLWATEFMSSVDLALNQRSMQQNEFLDAITMNKASELRRPLPESEVPSSMPKPSRSARTPNVNTSPTSQLQSEIPSNLPESPKPVASRRRARRAITTSRFDDFDDFVPTKSQPVASDSLLSEIPEKSQARDSQAVDTQAGGTQLKTQSRKRRSPPSDSEMQDSNQIDALFPAAAAIKRRRIDAARTRNSPSKSPEPESAGNASTNKPKGTAKQVYEELKKAKKKASEKEKDLNLVELARVRQEAEQEAARKDAEALRNAMEGVDISELRGLAHIEEMELPARAERSNRREAAIDPRWDARWNGRKNFKGFRRNRLADGNLRAPQKVFVPLEEVSRERARGPVGEDYLESSSRSEQVRDSQRSGRSGRSEGRQRLGRVDEDPDASTAPILKRRQAILAKRAAEAAQQDPGDDLDAHMSDVVVDSMGRDSPAEPVREVRREQPVQKGKRPAGSVAGNAPPLKKVRSETANGEETGFRFRRRKL